MISLRKTATELDRLEELHRTAMHCYSEALHATEQNAIELDESEAAHFRAQLQALQDRLRADAGTKELQAVQSSFTAELKEYHDSARNEIQRLRQEVQAAAAAVETFAGSITESGVVLESGLKRELNSLNQRATSDDIQEIRNAIHLSTAKIADGIEQMRTSNQLAIAQLKDEIRLLHQEVRDARRQQTDPPPEGRQQLNGKIDEYFKKNVSFSILLVVVHNLDGLQNCYAPKVIESGLRSFQARFENILPSSAVVGRWTRDQFAAILSTRPANTIEMSREVVRKLSEPFLESDKAGSHSLLFNPRAGIVEFNPGSDTAKFQAKLTQLASALAADAQRT